MNQPELINFVHRYFSSERKTAWTDIVLGLALAILAAVLWREYGKGSFARGLASPLGIAGAFLAVASSVYLPVVSRRSASLVTQYRGVAVQDARMAEEARLNKIVNHAYTNAFWICTALIVGGLALVGLHWGIPSRRGVACGLVLVGLLISATEGFSRYKNLRYLRELKPSSVSSAETNRL